jgi:7-cyano-7-deazaguanine synthase
MRKAFVLLSGGIDSTTCLYIARTQFDAVQAVSIDYGQRHRKEIEYAGITCIDLGITHTILNLSSVVPKTMLTDDKKAIPNISYSEIKGVSPTYVPYRNGLMLSALASFAAGEWDNFHKRDGNEAADFNEWGIFFGAHAEDAHNWAYPDCTPEWIGAMANAIYVGTYRGIRLHTPLQWLNKKQIITLGDNLGVDWCYTWSCYAGGDLHCGVCPTCRARRDGFAAAGVTDLTKYEKQAA